MQVAFVVCSVWHGVSACELGVGDSGRDKGQHRRTAGLRLARWRPGRACAPGNLVLLTEEEAETLAVVGVDAWCAERPKVAAFVRRTLAQVDEIFGAACDRD